MKRFEDYNPITVFIYFAAATAVPMFWIDPVLSAFSLCGVWRFIYFAEGACATLQFMRCFCGDGGN